MNQQLTFGGWLRQRRTELGVTRDELSERVGFSLDLLRKLESGDRRPSGQIAHLLAHYFRIPADERQAFVTFARTGRVPTSSASANSEDAPNAGNQARPWRRAYIHQTNLPAMLTPLIGREQELAAAREQILNSKARLLTLTGAPGIGKTRLAMQVASDLVDHFEDGVFFIDLAPVSEPDAVLTTAASTLGLKEAQDQPIENVLFYHLRERRMLMLLDNFEQVLDAATQVVRLLEASPWLKVLITSREALHVRGERRFPVSPLGVPDPKLLPPVETLADYPSVELFVERAQTVAPDFALTWENAEDVAALCAGLEGLPLAIELAAARARHLSPAEMRAGLSNRFKLLAEGARDLRPRHRTLRAAIQWSYDLLEEAEQRLFRRLGVFVGGFTPGAAELVWRTENDVPFTGLLMSLADKNLIRGERRNAAETLRFRILETLREYALEQLHESSEAAIIKREHARYFMRLAEEAEPHLEGAGQVEWLDRLESEHDNLRAALEWSLSGNDPQEKTGRVEIGLRIAGALATFWAGRGYWLEGKERCSQLLALPEASAQTWARARALITAGSMTRNMSDLIESSGYFTEALEISRRLGEKGLMTYALLGLGDLASQKGDDEQGAAYYEEALIVGREMGDKQPIAAALMSLASSLFYLGEHERAKALREECLALLRGLGDKNGVGTILLDMAEAEFATGNYDTAEALLEQSLHLGRETGSPFVMGVAHYYLGQIACATGDYRRAYELCKWGLIDAQRTGGRVGIGAHLGSLAQVAEGEGEYERAAKLHGALDSLIGAVGFALLPGHRPTIDRSKELVRVQLGEVVWQQAYNEGRAMSVEQAIAYALE